MNAAVIVYAPEMESYALDGHTPNGTAISAPVHLTSVRGGTFARGDKPVKSVVIGQHSMILKVDIKDVESHRA